MFKELNDRFFHENSDGKRFFHAHSLRKFFKTTAINHSRDYKRVNILAGHSLSKIDRAYEEINQDEMRRVYNKLIPYLSIEKTKVTTVKDPEQIKTEQRIERMESALNKAFGERKW